MWSAASTPVELDSSVVQVLATQELNSLGNSQLLHVKEGMTLIPTFSNHWEDATGKKDEVLSIVSGRASIHDIFSAIQAWVCLTHTVTETRCSLPLETMKQQSRVSSRARQATKAESPQRTNRRNKPQCHQSIREPTEFHRLLSGRDRVQHLGTASELRVYRKAQQRGVNCTEYS